jgi:hypothetical protein
MPAYNKTLNDTIIIVPTFKQRTVAKFTELTIWVRQEAFELIRGKYYFEWMTMVGSLSRSVGKLNIQNITVVSKIVNNFSRVLSETIFIITERISRIMRGIYNVINVVASNPKQQYKEYSGSFSLSDSFSQNWFRQCVEIVKLNMSLVFGSTALTFKEVVKIVQTFKQRLDMIVLREIVFINDFLKFGGRLKTFIEIISPIDTIKRAFTVTKTEIINLVDTFNKVAPTTFSEMFIIREQTWSIVNGMVFATFNEVIVLGASAIRQQIQTVLKEFIALSDTFLKRAGKEFLQGIKIESLFEIAKGKFFEETLTLVETFSRTMSRAFNEVVSILSTFTRLKNIIETISISDILSKNINPIFREVITVIDAAHKRVEKTFSEILTVLDTVTKRFLKTITNVLTIIESKVVFLIGKNLSQTFKLVQHISTSLNGWVTGLWRRAEKNIVDWTRVDKDWK